MKRRARILSIFLTFVMLLSLLPTTALAGGDDGGEPTTPSYIGVYASDGAATVDLDQTGSGTGWSYDGNKTLTLDGFVGTQIRFSCNGTDHTNINLVLNGTNTISNSSTYPLELPGDGDVLTISGDGALTITGDISHRSNLAVDSGSVIIDNPECSNFLDSLTVNGGSVTLKNSRVGDYGPMDEENGYDMSSAMSAATFSRGVTLNGGEIILQNNCIDSTNEFYSAWNHSNSPAVEGIEWDAYDENGTVITDSLTTTAHDYIRIAESGGGTGGEPSDITSFADLQAAVTNTYTEPTLLWYHGPEEFVFSEDITIPENLYFRAESDIRIPDGVTVTNNGEISNGWDFGEQNFAFTVDAGATIINHCQLWVSGDLTVEGTLKNEQSADRDTGASVVCYKNVSIPTGGVLEIGTDCVLEMANGDSYDISGTPTCIHDDASPYPNGRILWNYNVSSTEEFAAAAEAAAADTNSDHEYHISNYDSGYNACDITLPYEVTIPANTRVSVNRKNGVGSLIIPGDGAYYNEGNLDCYAPVTINGTLVNTGYVSIQDSGALTLGEYGKYNGTGHIGFSGTKDDMAALMPGFNPADFNEVDNMEDYVLLERICEPAVVTGARFELMDGESYLRWDWNEGADFTDTEDLILSFSQDGGSTWVYSHNIPKEDGVIQSDVIFDGIIRNMPAGTYNKIRFETVDINGAPVENAVAYGWDCTLNIAYETPSDLPASVAFAKTATDTANRYDLTVSGLTAGQYIWVQFHGEPSFDGRRWCPGSFGCVTDSTHTFTNKFMPDMAFEEGNDLYYIVQKFENTLTSDTEMSVKVTDLSAWTKGSLTATEPTDGCKVTWEYPADLCSVTTYILVDENGDGMFDSTEKTPVAPGASIPVGTRVAYEIDNIATGYRIKSVTMNGTDRTEGFVNGRYGGLSMTIQADTQITVELESVPNPLPTVTDVKLYLDENCTQPAGDMTVDADSRFYAKAAYSDGVDHPVYYIGGMWEFTTDGVTWEEASSWGSNRFDFWPGWSNHQELDFVNGSYDLRVRIQPKDLYSTGADMISNVIHINGGAQSGACQHDWGAGVVTTEPTCTDTGIRTYTCSLCGGTKTETIPALGHDWGDWIVTDATCTVDGSKTRSCSRCLETETVTIQAPGHKTELRNAKDATCTAEGYTGDQVCTICQETIERGTVIPKLDHTYGAWVKADENQHKRACACGDTQYADHSWDNGIVTKPATHTETGVKTYTCADCAANKSEIIPTTAEHSYGTWVNANDAQHKRTCACGDTQYENHIWDEGKVTTPPTETTDGVMAYTCQTCKATKTEVISMLEKQEVSWVPSVDTVTWTYGERSFVTNTAYNDSVGGSTLIYTSSNKNVADVDQDGKATIVGAGTTIITATAPAVPGKYAEGSASYTLIIEKAPLTVTAKDAATTYGQAPANNGWSAEGFVLGEGTNVVTGTPAYTYTYQQFGKAGEYEIVISGLSAKNYDITYAPGTLTVNKATDYTITLGNLEQHTGSVEAVTASIAPQDNTAQITVEYLVDGVWTANTPQNAGEYAVRAALTASENIVAQPGAYTEGTLIVKMGATVDNDISVDVTVEDGKAEITVSDEELDKILENANGEVSIDLGGIKDTEELVLPGNLIDELSKSDKADGMTITTEDSSITMSGPVLDTVADAMTSGEDKVTVRLTAVEEEELSSDQQEALNSITSDATIVEVSLVITHPDNSTTELHQLGGNVEVTVPFEGEVPAGKYIVVCYLSDDGNVTYVRATYDAATKQITFNTNHFSYYALFVSGDPAVVVNGGSGSGLYAEGTTVTVKADEKSGYRFDKWEVVAGDVTLTDASKTETTFTMPGENAELTATYTKISSGGGGGGSSTPTYTITAEKAKNGSVTISPKSATKGDTVTITVKPDKGYELDTLKVFDKNGDKVKIVEKNGKYTFTMPASKVTVEAVFVENKTLDNPFMDVSEDAYYFDPVLWAVENGVTSGTTATTFSPDATCTRAQTVTFLWRAMGSPEPAMTENPFSDVAADAYYYKAVLWAVEQGITSGTTATTFSPNATVTRAQTVTFLWRSAGSPKTSAENPFVDVAVDAYYAKAVLWAAEEGITSGTSTTTFGPNENCTRAQIVTFIFRDAEK